jgi:hypothetical protein
MTGYFAECVDKSAVLRAAVRQLPVVPEPQGWRFVGSFAIGGLQAVGFSRYCDSLLVVSSQGLGIFDAETGERVARDADPDWKAVFDDRNLRCQGFDILADEVIDLCGIDGGGLPMTTSRGEVLELVGMDFPQSAVVLSTNFRSLGLYAPSESMIVYKGYVRFCGFSWSRDCFVVVDEDMHIWSRVQ